jgi:hypothetical protein
MAYLENGSESCRKAISLSDAADVNFSGDSEAILLPSHHPKEFTPRLFHCREFSGCTSAGRPMCQFSETPESRGELEELWELPGE